MNNNGNARFERVPDIGDKFIALVLMLLLAVILIGGLYCLYKAMTGYGLPDAPPKMAPAIVFQPPR